MTKDARIARDVAIDELKTTNKYEALAEAADSKKVKDVVNDIAREEKVHTGEAAALLDDADPEAKDAMKEGVEEVRSFQESDDKETVQARFEGGKVVAPLPKPDGPLKYEVNPEAYERQRRYKKSVGPTFAELFANERGRVLEKTGMMSDEGLDGFKKGMIAKAGDFSSFDEDGNMFSPNPGRTTLYNFENPDNGSNVLDYDPYSTGHDGLDDLHKEHELVFDKEAEVPQYRAIAGNLDNKRLKTNQEDWIAKMQASGKRFDFVRPASGGMYAFKWNAPRTDDKHQGWGDVDVYKFDSNGRLVFNDGFARYGILFSPDRYKGKEGSALLNAILNDVNRLHPGGSFDPEIESILEDFDSVDKATAPNGNARGNDYRNMETKRDGSKGESREVRRGERRIKENESLKKEKETEGQYNDGELKTEEVEQPTIRDINAQSKDTQTKNRDKKGSKRTSTTDEKKVQLAREKDSAENEHNHGVYHHLRDKGQFMSEGDSLKDNEREGWHVTSDHLGTAPKAEGSPSTDAAFNQVKAESPSMSDGVISVGDRNKMDRLVQENLESAPARHQAELEARAKADEDRRARIAQSLNNIFGEE